MHDTLHNFSGLRQKLETIYERYNKKIYVHPDPLEFLYDFSDPLDREIVGMIASSLAYGRVRQILKSIFFVLSVMQKPSEFLANTSRTELYDVFSDFRHRFTSGADMAALLAAIKNIIDEYGSLENCFLSCCRNEEETLTEALSRFSKKLKKASATNENYSIPDPEKGSACKRPFMFLRWMVRRDEVDPGGWKKIPASKLVIPLDTHMFRIAKGLGFTQRKRADLSSSLEITRNFRMLAPDDPVRYDFSLTRFGIRNDLDCSHLIKFLVS